MTEQPEFDDGARARAKAGGVDRSTPKTRAFVLHPSTDRGPHRRDPEARLAEARGLALALDLELVGAEVAVVSQPRPATLLGPGKVAELGAAFDDADVELAIVDATLSPVQQRNLETAWKVKVLDRTGLILEIFGDRAQTREGVLQVDLAHLEYQRSRLVRSWTHLERQRGGAGFMGGPGETQIESDRRIISEKIVRLRRRLEKVAQTRALHRARRARAPQPVVALVGYTNAGKSTLFNRLTESDVLAKDMLFATLDPTMRAVKLPSGSECVFSDTVGFISDLPTELVAAFRATLEEVVAADVVIHVRDVSDPEADHRDDDVRQVLAAIGIGQETLAGMIDARNKSDRLDPEARMAEANAAARDPNAVLISAGEGDGVDALMRLVETRLRESSLVFEMAVPVNAGAAIAWLYEQGCVLDRIDDDEAARLTVRMSEVERGRFEKRFGSENLPIEARPASHDD